MADTGCGYHIFAGKECSRALALMSLKPEDCNSNLEDLDESKIKILDDWQKGAPLVSAHLMRKKI